MSGGASAGSRGSSRGSGRPSTSWASRQPPPPVTPYLSLQPVPSVASSGASASLRSATGASSSSAASSHAWLEEAMEVHACCPQRIVLEDSSAAFRWAGPPATSTITMLGRERFTNPNDLSKKRQLTFVSKVCPS